MVSNGQPTPRTKLLFLISEDWYFVSHRLPLGIAASKEGYDVVLATSVNDCQQEIEKHGIRVIPLQHFDRTRIGLFSEIRCLKELWSIYRTERPAIVHHVAIKPVVYGSIIARLCKIPAVINAIAGLGYVFTQKTLKNRILGRFISTILRFFAGSKNCRIIVQNDADREFMVNTLGIKDSQVTLIRGAGVDLEKYAFKPEPAISEDNPARIVFLSRMLSDKGVYEVVEAIRILKKEGVKAHFIFCGAPDPKNPKSIQEQELQGWHEEGLLEWKGPVKNVAKIYHSCHIALLASHYREGMPKSLLEAAACGRAIITTDTPGCRDCIQDGVSGILIPPQNSQALYKAIRVLLGNDTTRKNMGIQGRCLMENNFSLDYVVRETLMLYAKPRKNIIF